MKTRALWALLASAQTENWWGKAITVQSTQIFQN